MNDRLTRRAFLAVVGAGSLAGCSGVTGNRSSGSDGSPGSDRSTGAGRLETPSTATSTDGETARLPPLAERTLPLPMAPSRLREQAVSGGVPKDGIPSIDEPRFEDADQAGERLASEDVVFGVARNGVAKAYPQSILVHHEICNDTLDGEPVSVTYCPLTGTAMGFERGETTFGVSGHLVNDNLIMYDRATEHWWPQVPATAIPGWNEAASGRSDASESPAANEATGADGDGRTATNATIGRSLREFRVVWTTWGAWRDAFPDTRVLTEETGYLRNYGQDPYGSYNPRGGYYAPESEPLFPPLDPDDRYPPKEVVLGARTHEGAIAFHERSLRRKGLLTGDLDGVPYVAVHDEPLRTAYVYRNPEGATVALADEGVRVAGTIYPPADLPLTRVRAFDAMWFAWHGFYPESTVHA